ncbi:DUF3784 domain-containing protein [Mesobacillus zeae]|uniref:DUF3784 domain-containing protein n=1 Tax=Mesobacillus zeae TaxID=1917180 RepID=A0A398BBC6_9BACI|nr:DUF3784 domain-containing protein [Mesobacillus zeae]RID87469.1 DUF3784 domain-containing protein [Mesobacillus zeae]
MLVLIVVQLVIILLFFIIGWALLKKKAYWMLSGFRGRPQEEQNLLIENGYPQKAGKLIVYTAAGMTLFLPLFLTPFTYTIEVQFGFMILFLMGGMMYLSKYEVPHKRRRSFIITSSLFVVVLSIISVLTFLGYQEPVLVTRQDSFEITGMYGREWSYKDVKKVELLDKMPKVTYKENGFGMSDMSKGRFHVKEYGSSLLFVRKHSQPILFIKTKDQNIFITAITSDATQDWYNNLKGKAGI